MQTFQGRLQYARLIGKVSRSTLSRLTGLSVSLIGLIEGGKRGGARTAWSTVASLSRVLGVSTDWLWYGLGSEPTAESVQKAVKLAEREYVAELARADESHLKAA